MKIIDMESIGMEQVYNLSMQAPFHNYALANGLISKNSYAYAYLSYLTAWLRAYYPTEAMTAALSSVSGKEDRTRLYLNEAKELGIRVLPPSINLSQNDFGIVDDNTIIFGFNSIKGIGEATAAILGEASGEAYESLYDFLRRADPILMSRDVIVHFANAGCFDELLNNISMDELDFSIKKRHETLVNEMNELGVFLTDHPLNDATEKIAGKTTHTLGEVQTLPSGSNVRVAGVVLNIQKKMTRTGKRMYNIVLNDMETSFPISVMPKYAETLPDPPFEKGAIIVVNGKVTTYGDEDSSVPEIMCYNLEVIEDNNKINKNTFTVEISSEEELEQILNIVQESGPGLISIIIKLDKYPLFKANKMVDKISENKILEVLKNGSTR